MSSPMEIAMKELGELIAAAKSPQSAIDALKADTTSRAINIMYPPAPLVAAVIGGDATATLKGVIAYLATLGGGKVIAPRGYFFISDKISLRSGNNISITLEGNGGWETIFIRHSDYAAGDLFTIDNADGGGCKTVIRDIRIQNADSSFNNTSGSAIGIYNTDFVDLENIWIESGYIGVYVSAGNNITIDNVTYIQHHAYAAAGYTSLAGIYFETQGIHSVFITNSKFIGQGPTYAACLEAGMIVRSADGIQISNCAFSGKIGVLFEAQGIANIDDLYMNNCIIDGVAVSGIRFVGTNAPMVYHAIRITDTHINGINQAGGQEGVYIGGDVDNVQILGCNIGLFMGSGVTVAAGNSWRGTPKQKIMIHDNIISDNNMASVSGLSGVFINDGASGVSVKNNEINNESSTGHQAYGISIGDGCDKLSIQGNDLNGNAIGPILMPTIKPTDSLITNNLGVDSIVGGVASASTITIPVNPIIVISGTTSIATINGGWSGRRVTLMANDGAVQLVAGGNILKTTTIAQYSTVTLTNIGGNWVVGA